ncbi:MAG: hypothetical protein NTU48_01770 [Legionellales bacterium]|nr:hypothetical protein [Legionellales bacterium]
MGSGEKYLLINNITKEWFDGGQIEFAARGGMYLRQISYAGLTISQNGFACFEGSMPDISVYRINQDQTYSRMNLVQCSADRDTKYKLETTQDMIYERHFHRLTKGDVANPKHPTVRADANVTIRRKKYLRARLISLPTVFESDPMLQERDDGNSDFVGRFMSNMSQDTSPIPTDVAYQNSALKCSSLTMTELPTRVHRTYKPRTHFSRVPVSSAVTDKSIQNPAVTPPFMFRCLTLKTTVGKFAALALFLGCFGLVLSAYGTAVFCAAGGLAVTGAMACGISMFRKSRPEAIDPKELPCFMSNHR